MTETDGRSSAQLVIRAQPESPVSQMGSAQTSRSTVAFVIIGALLALVLGVMDQSIVATAGPTIISDLGGLNLYAWVFSAFILAQTTAMPILGRLSDLYGRKKFFLAGLIVFIFGSILSGASQSINQLIAFRALQGIGSGAFFTVGLAIVGASVRPEQRARVLGIAGSIFGLGAILGPTAGSYLVQLAGWRWIFYVNLPVGLVSLILVSMRLRESKSSQGKAAIDWLGLAALTGWVSFLLLGFLNGGSTFPWYSWQEALFFGGFAFLFGGFLIVETRVEEPILPLNLFRVRTISSSFVVQFVRGAVLLGQVAFISLFVQGALGGTIDDTRNVLYAFVVPFIAGSVSSGQVVSRSGYRVVTLIGIAIISFGSLLLAFIGPSPPVYGVMERVAFIGLGQGIAITAVLSAFQNSVERRQIGVASSLATFSLNLGGAIVVAILGSIQGNSLSARLSSIVLGAPLQDGAVLTKLFANPDQLGRILTSPGAFGRLTGNNPDLAALLPGIRNALGASITDGFLFVFFLTLVAIVASLFIRGSPKEARRSETADSPNQ